MKFYFKTITLALFLLTFYVKVIGQLTPMVKNYNENEVLKTFINNGKNKRNIANGYRITHSKEEDTLILKIDGKETISIKFTFKLDKGYCDYQRIDFSCDSCIINHMNEIINSKKYKWRKSNTDKYISKLKYQTELEIIRLNNICKRVIYRYVDKTKRDYEFNYTKLAL